MMGELCCREEEEYISTQHTHRRRKKSGKKIWPIPFRRVGASQSLSGTHSTQGSIQQSLIGSSRERYLTPHHPPPLVLCAASIYIAAEAIYTQQHTRTQNAQVNSFCFFFLFRLCSSAYIINNNANPVLFNSSEKAADYYI